jgi:hypothetical protein
MNFYLWNRTFKKRVIKVQNVKIYEKLKYSKVSEPPAEPSLPFKTVENH